jgi:hypothetical protein
VLAADVRTSEAQFVAQKIAQQETRLDGALILSAIYRDRYIE